MTAPHYHFVTRWRFTARVEEVADILEDVDGLPQWWPEVFGSVETVVPGGAHGLGRVVNVSSKGALPYFLHWRFRVVEERYPHGALIEASGDLTGTGQWTIAQDGQFSNVLYEWRVRGEKPLLRRLSWLLRPVFSWNHDWAMRRGRVALERELRRRRATAMTGR